MNLPGPQDLRGEKQEQNKASLLLVVAQTALLRLIDLVPVVVT